jgi:hypothetical protein
MAREARRYLDLVEIADRRTLDPFVETPERRR